MGADIDNIRILTLNVWGVYYAKSIKERMLAMGRAIRAYDIVCLQEQFEECDWELILQSCSATHPYSIRFPSSFVGSGLAVLSKYPITHHAYEMFEVNGHPERIDHGDYWCFRGIAHCQIRVPDGSASRGSETLFIYNTHLHAQWQRDPKGGHKEERYVAVRTCQALQMAQYIVSTSQGARTLADLKCGTARQPRSRVVVLGDLNSGPDSIEVRTLKAYCRKKGLMLQRAVPTVPQNQSFTRENAFLQGHGNVWGLLNLLGMSEEIPIQLDHILVSTPGILIVKEGEVVLNDNNFVAPGCPISDHFGVATTIRCCPFTVPAVSYSGPMKECSDEQTDADLREAQEILLKGAERYEREKQRFTRGVKILGFVAAITAGTNLLVKGAQKKALVCATCGAGMCLSALLSILSRNSGSYILRRYAGDITEVFHATA